MVFVYASAYLIFAFVLYHVAVATTDPRVLNRPAAASAAVFWPVVLPAVVIIALVSKDAPEADTPRDEADEALARLER